MTTNTFVTPSAFLKGKSIKLKVGDVVDFTALGNGPHPLHGPIPPLTVTAAKEDGSLLEGTIVCPGLAAADGKEAVTCGTVVTVRAGDVFQKRRCPDHQKVFARRKAKPVVDPAVKAQKEKAAAEAEKKKAEEKAKKAEEKKAAAAKKAAEKLAEAEAKAKVAAEKKAAAPPKKAAGKTAAEMLKAG